MKINSMTTKKKKFNGVKFLVRSIRVVFSFLIMRKLGYILKMMSPLKSYGLNFNEVLYVGEKSSRLW